MNKRTTRAGLFHYPRAAANRPSIPKPLAAIAATLLVLIGVFTVGVSPAAAGTDHGQPQIIVNPGGGVLTDGSDGVRFEINDSQGYDEVRYQNTTQYCCSKVAPMLNIGGTLWGEGGPASSGTSWTNLEIVSTGGSTTTASGTDLGSGTALIRYTANHNGLSYVLDRSVSYTFPNNFVSETYTITIPAGNTETVKFYQGGDTAPGNSDSGIGVMVTDPVRTVYSVNPNSDIQIGYGEVPGETPFDGALSGPFYDPYTVVQAGNDIGFGVDTNVHDAGLMVQWTIGTDPGVHQRVMRTYVGARGASLSASLSSETTDAGQAVDLGLALLNTGSTDETGLGFAFALPAGLAISSTAPTNTCGGTLTATAGGSTITLSGVDLVAAGSCLVTVPVVAANPGDYQITSASVTSVTGMENLVGSTTLSVAGTSILTASITPTSVDPGRSAQLALTITNDTGANGTGLGYTVTLPSGLTVGSGAPNNACGGSLAAATGGSTISLTGVTVADGADCTVTLPVTAAAPGSYRLSNASAGNLAGLTAAIDETLSVTGVSMLSAAFNPTSSLAGQSANLKLSIANRTAGNSPNVRFTVNLPSGLKIGPGGATKTCTGTLTASAGTSAVTLTGASVGAGQTCAVTLPVTAASAGTYRLSNGSANNLSGLTAAIDTALTVTAPATGDSVCAGYGGWTAVSDQVERLYRSVLGRPADESGQLYWTRARLAGMSAEQLAATLLASSEQLGRTGATTDGAFVDRLYLTALGRRADAGGKAYWVGRLGAGMPRSAMVIAFSDSPENVARTNTMAPMSDAQAQVCRLYKTLFGRSPDDGGLAYWTGKMAEGWSPTAIANGMMRQNEAASIRTMSTTDFIGRLYRNSALHRPADSSGLTFWSSRTSTLGRPPVALVLSNRMEKIES